MDTDRDDLGGGDGGTFDVDLFCLQSRPREMLMEPITREDLRGFLHTVRQTYIRAGEITPEFTKVLDSLTAVAEDDTSPGLQFAPLPPPSGITDGDIPF